MISVLAERPFVVETIKIKINNYLALHTGQTMNSSVVAMVNVSRLTSGTTTGYLGFVVCFLFSLFVPNWSKFILSFVTIDTGT